MPVLIDVGRAVLTLTVNDDCGANAPGGGGFQPDNDCAKGGGSPEARAKEAEGKPPGEGHGVTHAKHFRSMLDRVSKPDGGFTYQPLTDDEPDKGFALSIHPERSFAMDADKVTYKALEEYVLKNFDLLTNKDNFMGAWHDPASGKVFLDVSRVTDDEEEAHNLALEYDQIAYFDLARMSSVTVNPDATSGGVNNAKGPTYSSWGHNGREDREAVHEANGQTSRSNGSGRDTAQARRTREEAEEAQTVNSDCGANAPGGGGFQAGNDCAKGSRAAYLEKQIAKAKETEKGLKTKLLDAQDAYNQYTSGKEFDAYKDDPEFIKLRTEYNKASGKLLDHQEPIRKGEEELRILGLKGSVTDHKIEVSVAKGVDVHPETAQALVNNLVKKPWGTDESKWIASRYKYELTGQRDNIYQFKITNKEPFDALPEDALETVPEKPGHVYRGMSTEEWEASVERGHIESIGHYNLSQEGLTFYGSARTAEHYATGFAPYAFQSTPGRPGVIVEIPRSLVMDTNDDPRIPNSEYAHKGNIPLNSITSRYESIATGFREGTVEAVVDSYKGTVTEGSRSSPSVSYKIAKVGVTRLLNNRDCGANAPGGGGFQAGNDCAKLRGTVRGKDGKLKLDDGSDLPAHTPKNIPPAWTNVEIDEDPEADLLVKGRDSKGRQQSIYSKAHTERAAAKKFDRITKLDKMKGKIAKQIEKDLNSDDEETREAAHVARLIGETGIRPGSNKDTGAAKKAYGATTLEGRHVVTRGDKTYLKFTGKKGVDIKVEVFGDTAKDLRERAVSSKAKLFKANDRTLATYFDNVTEGRFTPKDFRTAKGTSIAKALVKAGTKPEGEKEYKKAVREVAKTVSDQLGNTPTVALQSYIDPRVFLAWRPE